MLSGGRTLLVLYKRNRRDLRGCLWRFGVYPPPTNLQANTQQVLEPEARNQE